MYEILVKWGLETLSKIGGQEHQGELALVLEAVKTKNALVEKRFELSASAAESLLELTLNLEDSLRELQESTETGDDASTNARKYLARLERELHPIYYRRLRRIRARFEVGNDLLSSYSIEVSKFLHIKNVKDILNASNADRINKINMVYRQLWTLAADIMLSLVRVTSTDLRFWLSDEPHGRRSDAWAARDLKAAKDYFLSDNPEFNTFYLAIEDDGGTDRFWDPDENAV